MEGDFHQVMVEFTMESNFLLCETVGSAVALRVVFPN
jgi:hypothetical protein